MKIHHTNIIVALFVSLVFIGCKTSELDTFSAKESIYFMQAIERYPTDSATVSFAYLPASQKDSTYLVDISITGTPKSQERSFQLEIDPQSTARKGVHFEFLNPAFVIPANSLHTLVPVKLNRTKEMETKELTIILKLKENENFNIDIPYHTIGTDKKLSMTTWRIAINDILIQPKAWLDSYLGTFSKKKLFLLAELAGISDLNNLNDYNLTPVSKLVFYGNYMQRYLDEMNAKGKTIYEEDGTPMIMGPAVQ